MSAFYVIVLTKVFHLILVKCYTKLIHQYIYEFNCTALSSGGGRLLAKPVIMYKTIIMWLKPEPDTGSDISEVTSSLWTGCADINSKLAYTMAAFTLQFLHILRLYYFVYMANCKVK